MGEQFLNSVHLCPKSMADFSSFLVNEKPESFTVNKMRLLFTVNNSELLFTNRYIGEQISAFVHGEQYVVFVHLRIFNLIGTVLSTLSSR